MGVAPAKTEVPFEWDGTSYRLVFDINALCAFEDLTGLSVDALIGQRHKVNILRASMWAGLREHHAGMNVKSVGDLIFAMGAPKARELVDEAVSKAFPPPPEETEEGSADADPPKGKAKPKDEDGTGKPSS